MADQSRFPELPGALYPLGRNCCGAPDATACHQRGLCWMEGVHPESPGYTAAAPAAADAGSGVDPAEIARQRVLGWPDMHPEDFCHTCGRPNPTWFADTAEWQTATGSTGDGGGILCPSCFCALWEQVTGKTAIIWRLSIDPRSRDAAVGAPTGQFSLALNGQEVTVTEVPELPERGLTSLTYNYRTAIQVRSVDDLDGRVLLHEILHALLRTDPQQVCPADDPRHEDFVRMLTAGLHDAGGFRRAVRPSPDSEAVPDPRFRDQLGTDELREALVALAWHDVTCPEAEDCRDRQLHAASAPVANGGILTRFLARLDTLGGESRG